MEDVELTTDTGPYTDSIEVIDNSTNANNLEVRIEETLNRSRKRLKKDPSN